MTLIKRKINFLAWLKSAIYISVVGGVILSSKSASAIVLGFETDTELLGTFSMSDQDFQPDERFQHVIEGQYWGGIIYVPRERRAYNDILGISGVFYHKSIPSHPEDSSAGENYLFNFFIYTDEIDNGTTNYEFLEMPTSLLGHSENHSDLFSAKLNATISRTLGFNRITSWNFTVNGEHRSEPVPEPTTIFGSALALGVGGWLKRKKISQQNKTTPQR